MSNHNTINCRRKQKYYLQSYNTNKQNLNHQPKEYPPRHNFQPTNNFTQNFKQNSKFCRYCKKSGHEISECRIRDYKNKQEFSSNNVHLNFTRPLTTNTALEKAPQVNQVFEN